MPRVTVRRLGKRFVGSVELRMGIAVSVDSLGRFSLVRFWWLRPVKLRFVMMSCGMSGG